MSYDIRKNPPKWCKDAVPSDKGWRHPKTGELLVSVRGGVEFKVAEPVKEVAIKPENVTVDVQVEEVKTETTKKRGGRKKKTEATE